VVRTLPKPVFKGFAAGVNGSEVRIFGSAARRTNALTFT
jgi:hypothetical protein